WNVAGESIECCSEIHARDLRILDPLLSYPSAILGRERAIVLNLEHIKAIVTAEERPYIPVEWSGVSLNELTHLSS
ncbi:magnesium transporter MRS2-2-like protein, partial [Tanacetum coccineum]